MQKWFRKINANRVFRQCAGLLIGFLYWLSSSFVWAQSTHQSVVNITFERQTLGRMPIVSDTSVLKAGDVQFVIFNKSTRKKHRHTVILARLDKEMSELQTKAFGTTVDLSASKMTQIAKFSNIDPLETIKLTVNLVPGYYVIFCSRKRHYSAEGDVKFTVVE